MAPTDPPPAQKPSAARFSASGGHLGPGFQPVKDSAYSRRVGTGFRKRSCESIKGTSNNCNQSSGPPNLPAKVYALFLFRFYAVPPKDVRDCQLRQLFEVPISNPIVLSVEIAFGASGHGN